MSALKNLGLMAMLSVAGYIAAQILADITAIKVALIVGMSIDAGTFIYPITFTLRDMIHKTWGRKMSKAVIVTAGAINLFMAAFFSFVIWLPAHPDWGFQYEFATALGPVWRIVFASITAEIIAELIDTEAYSFWVNKITKRFQWGRVLFSNAFSIPIDSLAFCFIAFWGTLPNSVVLGIAASNMLIKFVMTLISLPGIYLVPDGNYKEM
jgi:uncharacterized integral membrane protein (TIGR00697 family)